ncbi:MAG: ABC transporter permease [Candidatus Electryonea clarkiae]|nr:ABC transporter permease [Candidatus Electryonea clarkiae]MDP8287516.1 ABC transporter permease [Candidatus Electryonea clarkiae]
MFRPIFYLVKKEFRQIFRDHIMLRIILFVPIVQLFIFGYAVNMDLEEVRLSVLDHDKTALSRNLIESYFASGLFIPAPFASNPGDLDKLIFQGDADMTLWIPRNYSADITAGRPVQLSIAINGSNASLAGRAGGYAGAVIRQETEKILEDIKLKNPILAGRFRRVEPVTRFYYNPELKSRVYMVPAIVVLIVTIISGLLTGMAVVREKEIGTLEQLMVSPITPAQLIAGKTIPFAIISFVDIAVAAVIAVLWFKIPLEGSILLLAGCMLIYLLVTLGGGLLASTVSKTQQQALFTVWFFLVFGILMSGFFFPIQNMPQWAQLLTYLNPLRYVMEIVRGIFLKGSTAQDLLPQIIPLLILGVFTFTAAVLRFNKRLT